MSQNPPGLEDFCGTVRLFPLPNLVLFPHVAQPLHIFEPRYRQMTADALEDDRLLAMALLQPDAEEQGAAPPIHRVVCVGRILQVARTTPFQHGGDTIRMTFCCGIASSDEGAPEAFSIDAMIARADKRVYRAKGDGRDQVVTG